MCANDIGLETSHVEILASPELLERQTETDVIRKAVEIVSQKGSCKQVLNKNVQQNTQRTLDTRGEKTESHGRQRWGVKMQGLWKKRGGKRKQEDR